VSASEKLKAIMAESFAAPWHYDQPGGTPSDIRDFRRTALPQIVEVLETAEDAVEYGAEFVPGTNLGRALVALDKALGTEPAPDTGIAADYWESAE